MPLTWVPRDVEPGSRPGTPVDAELETALREGGRVDVLLLLPPVPPPLDGLLLLRAPDRCAWKGDQGSDDGLLAESSASVCSCCAASASTSSVAGGGGLILLRRGLSDVDGLEFDTCLLLSVFDFVGFVFLAVCRGRALAGTGDDGAASESGISLLDAGPGVAVLREDAEN